MACEDRKVDARDLRLKLQKKNLQQTASGVRDLREKLSGTMHAQPVNADPPKLKSEAAKPGRKSVAVEAPEPEIKKIASVATKKKTPQKAISFTSLIYKLFHRPIFFFFLNNCVLLIL